MNSAEEWRPVCDFPDYAVSNEGVVKRTVADRYGRNSGVVINGCVGNHGYLIITLHKDARQTTRLLHRIVCEAFHGRAPSPGHHAAHGDGNRANNSARNLRWATPSENNMDKHSHGTMKVGAQHHAHSKPECMPRGMSHGNAKLTDEMVGKIRRDDRPQKVIARQYGVSQSLVSQVKTRSIWAHIR